MRAADGSPPRRRGIRRGRRAAGQEPMRRRGRRPAAVTARSVPALPPARGRIVRSEDGTELHVETYGPQTAPTLFLVHGWTCAIRFWNDQIRALSREFRVVAFDLRGHGRSASAATGDYSTAAFAADVEAVLDAVLAPGEKAVLAGHSLGAMSLAAWARRFPEQVERRAAAVAMLSTGLGDLVAVSTIAGAVNRFSALKRPVGGRLLGVATPVPKRAGRALTRAVRYIALSPDASPEQVAICEEMFRSCSGPVRGACGVHLARLDLHDAAAVITVPTLVLVGARDKLTPMPQAERLAESLPRLAELVVLPLVGHMTPIEAPGEVNGHLSKLVRHHLVARGGEPGPGRRQLVGA
jgi:pimeloyl-ACP methyl ester carboxylesterase